MKIKTDTTFDGVHITELNDTSKITLDGVELVPLKTGWIPVTERLPEKTDWYLCTLSGHLAQTIVDMCRFETVNGGFWSGGIEYNVVAWMPLPKPYEKEVNK